MKIETGNPVTTGCYAVYADAELGAHGMRFWLAGTGWLEHVADPINITGWCGPLPMRSLPDPVRTRRKAAPVPQAFDL